MLDFIRDKKRTHYATKLNKQNVGENVTLMGWVHRRRDLGGLIFVDPLLSTSKMRSWNV